jgi:hypothetical protein
MKIERNNYIEIATSMYKLLETPVKKIDYDKWTEFIETHKDYFVWYEDTPDGIDTKENIDKIPDWAKEGVLYSLNKTNAYSTNKIVKHPFDLIVRYFKDKGIVKIDIEKTMTKQIAEILLKMARFLDAKLIIIGNKILENEEQLENKNPMSRKELIELGYNIKTCKDIEKLAVMIDLFNENVPHPDGARLFNYPENYEKHRGGDI